MNAPLSQFDVVERLIPFGGRISEQYSQTIGPSEKLKAIK